MLTTDDYNICMPSFLCQGGPNHGISVGNSVSTADTAYPNTSTGRPFHPNDVNFCYIAVE